MLVATLLLNICLSAQAVQLRTSRPGNLFAYGKPVEIEINVTRPPQSPLLLPWKLLRFPKTTIKSGTLKVPAKFAGSKHFQLGKLARGYYEFFLGKNGSAQKIPFGVVTDRSDQNPPSGPLNVDGATCWLVPKGKHEIFAKVLRMVQIGWIRERFSWRAVEKARGKFNWGIYDEVAKILAHHGIRVYQIFHDSPSWTHKGKPRTRNPEDLRDVYNFAKKAANHYKGQVLAWEVWNEPDIWFWPDLSDTFSGVQKAAYLGFKKGNPHLLVLLGSFCRGRSPFDDHLFATRIKDYFDIFNWHIYAPPLKYASTLQGYLKLLKREGCAGRPIWLTEAGIHLKATQPGGELSSEDEKRQAYFIPKSFACSLAAGTDRHFFFVLPYYLERGIQFGAFRADLSVRPSFIAIAAAVELLGKGRYLGAFANQNQEGFTALAFDTGKDIALVLWNEGKEEKEVSIPVSKPNVLVADLMGKRTWRKSSAGQLKVKVGPEPFYVIGTGKQILKHLKGTPRKPGRIQPTHPCPVIIRGQAEGLRINKLSDFYLVRSKEFLYKVEVCNLSEKESFSGKLFVEASDTWKLDPSQLRLSLPPMGREVLQVKVKVVKPKAGTYSIKLKPKFPGITPAPCVSFFRLDPSLLKAKK